jgi:hypothetical protein
VTLFQEIAKEEVVWVEKLWNVTMNYLRMKIVWLSFVGQTARNAC